MQRDYKKELEKIIDDLQCPKDFKCYKSGFENLCKATDIGLESYLRCLEEDSYACKFSLSFGNAYLCQCPLRVYISKKLKE
jgi:hypothetical protein